MTHLPPQLLELLREGPAALRDAPLPPPAEGWRVAFLLPPLTREEREVVDRLAAALDARGHDATLSNERTDAPADADVVLAAGPLAAPRALRHPHAAARAQLLLTDPGLAPAAARLLAAPLLARPDLPVIAVRNLPGAASFTPGVDTATFRPRPVLRREDLVLLSAPRHALPLGLLALTELHRRRPQLELATPRPVEADLPLTTLDVRTPDELATAANAATVALAPGSGLGVPDLMGCGLPVVGTDPLLAPAAVVIEPDPLALADAAERLLDDLAERADRTRAGLALAAERTWDAAAEAVETALASTLSRS